MKPVYQKISFYPFSFHRFPNNDQFAIVRYNIIKHRWIVIEKRNGSEQSIEEYVHELNEGAGIITEVFIIGYTE